MGQAAVDLPDLPEKTPAPLGSADDLLSELADQEIDRMLAESDAAPKTAQADSHTPAEQALAAAETDAQQPPELAKAAASAAAGADQAVIDAQLEEVFKALMAEQQPSDAPAAPPSAPSEETAAPAPVAEAPVAQPVQPVVPAPAPPPPAPPPPAPVAAPKPAVVTTPEPAQELPAAAATSPAVRVLEWINWPMRACPDVVRDVLGRVAILTMLNAVGVLLYVLLFRRH